MVKKCYGILDDPNLIYGEGCYDDLKNCIKDALRSGANCFMIADIGEFSINAYEICKTLQQKHKRSFTITIVSARIKDKDIINRYKDDNILFVYSEVPHSYQFTLSKINQFIVH